jgi:serine/threonine-protein kinase RsbW
MHTVVNSPASWQTCVPHHARSAAAIRRWLAGIVESLGGAGLADLHAVATELICNAVRHATPLPDGGIEVQCELRDDEMLLSVTDGGANTKPRMRTLDTNAVDGRGLLIVSALSAQWGVKDETVGRTVWARMSLTPTPVMSESIH